MDFIDYNALESLTIPDVANEAISTGTKIKVALGAIAAAVLGIGYLSLRRSDKENAKKTKMKMDQYYTSKGIDPNDQAAVEIYKKNLQASILKDAKDMCSKVSKTSSFKKNAEAAAKEFAQKLNNNPDYEGSTFTYYPNKMDFFTVDVMDSKNFRIYSIDPKSKCITANRGNPINQDYALIEFSWDYFYDAVANIVTALSKKYSDEIDQQILFIDYTAGDDTICGFDVTIAI